MQSFCIDSSVLGSERHLVVDDGYRWSDSVPRESWHLSGKLKTSKCLDTLLAISGKNVATIPDRYVESFRQVLTGSSFSSTDIKWVHALPGPVYKQYFKNIVSETTSIFTQLPFRYFEDAWVHGTRLLSLLKPSRIDVSEWEALSRDSSQNSTVIESFRPNRSGYAQTAEYDRFATRTGRLTIASGPQILTLKKDNRKILRSAFEDGSVVSLDFRALEVRIVAAEAGKNFGQGDVYDDLSKELFGGRVERDIVKVAVIGELYGISRATLVSRLRIEESTVDRFISTIREFFGTAYLRSRLRDELQLEGFVRNKFGRPLRVPPDSDNLLVNTFAQSSGVDVSLIGFKRVLDSLGTDGIRPLFVLHDALILDVRGDRTKDAESMVEIDIPGYEASFPLKYEKISN